MRKALSVLAVIMLGACTQTASTPPSPVGANATTPAPSATSQPAAPAGPTAAELAARNDSLVKDRTDHVNEILASIVGKEQMPAEQVYKNIQLFKGMPAARLLAIMNRGFSNSLGVSCSHCHVVGEFDKEDKPQKQIARDMFAMVNTINGTILPSIKNLKSPNPTVNCGTCHNGRPRPGAGSAATPAPAPRAP